MKHELIIVEERTYERADARWLRVRCSTDSDCVMVEARIEPADSADAFLDVLRLGHERLHAAVSSDTQGSGGGGNG